MDLLIFCVFLGVLGAAVVGVKSPCMDFTTVTLKNGKTAQREKNVGRCTCLAARKQEMDQRMQDKWVPACEDNGSWAKKQQDMIGAWCVDSNGNQITEKLFKQPWTLKC